MSSLTVRTTDDVLRLTLNRPDKGNALSADLVDALYDALNNRDPTWRTLVLAGEGRHFCTGFDLSGLEDMSDAELLQRFVRLELLLQKISALPCASLALASGRITGAGADLFVACECRAIVGNASVSFPGAGFGIVLGTHRLVQRVGAGKAREIVRSGRELTAEQALACGLATDIVDPSGVSALIEREAAAARRLDVQTAVALQAIGETREDEALAALVRSAARPGLKDRILAYRSAQMRARR
jgi:enoyl-CoA hydratase/carnithine racemase